MSEEQKHTAEKDVAEVRALAARARGSSRFYSYTGAPAIALLALADDLDALAASMSTRVTPPVETQVSRNERGGDDA